MEMLICCFYSVVCFLAGAVVSGGFRISAHEMLTATKNNSEDQLAVDIASMLSYDAQKQEESDID